MNLYFLKLGEIILKGKNRYLFEKILQNNLKEKLKSDLIKLENFGGVYLIYTKNSVENELQKIFGIKKILTVKQFSNLEELLTHLQSQKSTKFNLSVKRGDKDYPLNSLEIKAKIIQILQQKGFQFDQESDLRWHIEYRRKNFYLAEKEINGLGGLPVGSSGKGIALLSAGFDSPVASFLAMKRGLKVTFLHFHSYPQTTQETLEAVEKLVQVLANYNLSSQLYFINILDLQRFYFQKIPREYLVIFYRRSMFRLAERLLQETKAHTLITGENLGQVASQTIENMKVISESTHSFIFRPLLGFDKEEIIELSKKIGTFEISNKKFEDCCSLFIPKKVKTKAKIKEVLKIENNIKKEIQILEDEIYQKKKLRQIGQ